MPDDAQPHAHFLPVTRTARYYTMGAPIDEADEVWVVLHGYGQLAEHFIRPFRVLCDGRRCIVAPEALSRFYLEATSDRVGASWMTRADRQHEIDDYVAYLDALLAQLQEQGLRDNAALHVLGFSQSTATACRWAALGTPQIDRLILWAGDVPPDLDLHAHGASLHNLVLVVGTRDTYITPDRLAAVQERLMQHAIPFRTLTFEGPHRIEVDVLHRLAAP